MTLYLQATPSIASNKTAAVHRDCLKHTSVTYLRKSVEAAEGDARNIDGILQEGCRECERDMHGAVDSESVNHRVDCVL